MARRGRRRKQPLNGIKEKKGYWNLKKEALDHTMWKIRFGRISRSHVRGKRSNEFLDIIYEYFKLLSLILSPQLHIPMKQDCKWCASCRSIIAQ